MAVSAIPDTEPVFRQILIALLDAAVDVDHAVVEFDDDPFDELRVGLREDCRNRQLARAERNLRNVRIEHAVFHMDQDRPVAIAFHHFDRVNLAVIRGPVAVHFKLHLRAEFGVDVVGDPPVDQIELERMIVLEERDSLFFELLLPVGGHLRRALDRIHVLEFIRALPIFNQRV